MPASHLTTQDFEQQTNKGLALIDFWATWCGPCRIVGPVIDELAEEYQDKILVVKIDVDKEPTLAEKFQVMSVPTVIVLKDGQELERTIGFVDKEGYKNLIEKHLK